MNKAALFLIVFIFFLGFCQGRDFLIETVDNGKHPEAGEDYYNFDYHYGINDVYNDYQDHNQHIKGKPTPAGQNKERSSTPVGFGKNPHQGRKKTTTSGTTAPDPNPNRKRKTTPSGAKDYYDDYHNFNDVYNDYTDYQVGKNKARKPTTRAFNKKRSTINRNKERKPTTPKRNIRRSSTID